MIMGGVGLKRRGQQQLRFLFVDARVKWVRDRGLDHAVEREKNLRAMVGLKNLIKSEPSKSIPVSIAADNKTKLGLPTRAIEFIRKYPSIFQEFVPPGAGGIAAVRPHVRLTPEVASIDEEEQLIYERDSYREDAANRLLKLLMLTRANKMPISILETLKWDLGLPPDYARTLVTQFPDFFQISSSTDSNRLELELVWWSDELAVSVMQKNAKGMPPQFPLQYSRGYDLEKKVKTWVDEWQKLPYISPYQDAFHLPPNTDQADKWAVAVLHELLHLFISNKTDRDNIFCLAHYLGFGSRFKRSLINHPGIFYVSSKIRTHTVLLRESYKRDLLLQKHPLMGIRYQYIHLMNKLNHQVKQHKQTPTDAAQGAMDSDADVEDEDEDEDEGISTDEHDSDEDQLVGRGRRPINVYGPVETKTPPRTMVQPTSKRKGHNMVGDRVPTPTPPQRKTEHLGKYASGVRSPGRTNHSTTQGRLSTERAYTR